MSLQINDTQLTPSQHEKVLYLVSAAQNSFCESYVNKESKMLIWEVIDCYKCIELLVKSKSKPRTGALMITDKTYQFFIGPKGGIQKISCIGGDHTKRTLLAMIRIGYLSF